MEEILRIIIVNIIMSFLIYFYQFLSNYHALINNEYKMKKEQIEIDTLIREICITSFSIIVSTSILILMLRHWNAQLETSFFFFILLTK